MNTWINSKKSNLFVYLPILEYFYSLFGPITKFFNVYIHVCVCLCVCMCVSVCVFVCV